MGKRAWMVRAEGGKLADQFFKNKAVAVGNPDDPVNLSNYHDKSALNKHLSKHYYWDNDNQRNTWIGIYWRFSHEISKGDIILTYKTTTRTFFIGEATSNYIFNPKSALEYPHIIRVKEWVEVPRKKLSRYLSRSLGCPLTLFEVTDHLEEIEAHFKGVPFDVTTIKEPVVRRKRRTTSVDKRTLMEKHIRDILIFNWDSLEELHGWEIYKEKGHLKGREFRTSDGGRIDILAQKKKGPGWLVIELKRSEAGVETIDQIERYMSWVKRNLGAPVKGLIVCLEDAPGLRQSLKNTNNVDLMLYEVSFSLKEPPKEGKKNG
jgi:predicted Mrr-cat superfamily restriction endonuclease